MLIIQEDQLNDSQINTLIVVALTSNLRLAAAPGNVFIGRDDSGIPRDSVINVSQVLTIDKSFLADQVSSLPRETMELADVGLRLTLGL